MALWRTWSRLSFRRVEFLRRKRTPTRKFPIGTYTRGRRYREIRRDGASGGSAEVLFSLRGFSWTSRERSEKDRPWNYGIPSYTRRPDFRVAEHSVRVYKTVLWRVTSVEAERFSKRGRPVARERQEETRLYFGPDEARWSVIGANESTGSHATRVRLIARLRVTRILHTYVTCADTYTLLYIYYAIILR